MANALESNDLAQSVAIIGLAGRFPKAKNITEYWQNLCNGTDAISFFSDEELLASEVDPLLLQNPHYVKASGVLDDIDLFDASFFNISPREAEIMDPQHRLFLECAWEALDDAAYSPDSYDGCIGVYVGVSTNGYILRHYNNSNLLETANIFQINIGNAKDFLPTRVSYKLNLKGPSINVQTACSSSLVATYLACQSLLTYQTDMTLVGGVSLSVPMKAGYLYQEGGVFSPDGHCRAFDARAQGTVAGSGVGVVVLKRLEDALADGDHIYAVIRGAAINNDGATKVGYTAPSVDGQTSVILMALAMAGVDPDTITYVETHGSGTSLGDTIEIKALTQAFRKHTQRNQFCAIGSVKTNIGHLDAAAGVASLIKTALALKYKQLPPSLHFERSNPAIDFKNSPFYVATELSQWKTSNSPRRAGVSAFGIGGTNAHIILEEAPERPVKPALPTPQLLALSAKTPSALTATSLRVADYLRQHPHLSLADVTYTLQIGRSAFNYRQVAVCHTIDDAIQLLETRDSKRVFLGDDLNQRKEPAVVFMFSGLGDHYINMASELYQLEPVFRAHVDKCAEFLRPYLSLDLRDVLYPDWQLNQTDRSQYGSANQKFDLRKMLGRSQESPTDAELRFNQTWISQPAIFVIEYALAELWFATGIRPRAMIGYSIGEYVAACVAGVLTLEEALALVAHRAQLIQQSPPGAMLAVPLPENEILPLLANGLSLCATSGPTLCVVGGSTETIEALHSRLAHQNILCQRLAVTHAFHSKMMEELIEPFTKLIRSFRLRAPNIPYISNVTGTWITAAQATDPGYWVQHLCQTVRFAEGMSELWQHSNQILLEVGPGQTLCSLALQHPVAKGREDRIVLPSLSPRYNQQPDRKFLFNTLGQLWLAGITVKWEALYIQQTRQRIPLPVYPFERQRFWLEPPPTEQVQLHTAPLSAAQGGAIGRAVSLLNKSNIDDWFYVPLWKQSVPPASFKQIAAQEQIWLIFTDELGIAASIAEQLEHKNQHVVRVQVGKKFHKIDSSLYTIDPHRKEDYEDLLVQLHISEKLPAKIVYCWGVSGELNAKESQYAYFYSLLFLAQALGAHIFTDSIHLCVIASGMHLITNHDTLCLEKAMLQGICTVIPQEYANTSCQIIDIEDLSIRDSGNQRLIELLTRELMAGSSDTVIAYRGAQRWVRTFEAVRLEGNAGQPTRLRTGGTYLITGGLGKIGLTFAEYLARRYQANLILVGRSGLLDRDAWAQWLAAHAPKDRVSVRIRKVQSLEDLGAKILVVQADVTDEDSIRASVAQAEELFGPINGVIHAAGLVEFDAIRLISETKPGDAEQHFNPKVQGLYTLQKVFRDKQPDFYLLISSVASVIGGLGFAAYSSANIFMDAFAYKQSQQGSSSWISVNWDLIESFEEHTEVLQRILSQDSLTQLILSPVDLAARISTWVNRKSLEHPQQTRKMSSRAHLRTPYTPPTTKLEEQILKVWQGVLGIEEIGVHDDFFQLGGHSLMATQVISRLRRFSQLDLTLRAIFESPTIADLASYIEEMLIKEIEALSDDEAERRLTLLEDSESI